MSGRLPGYGERDQERWRGKIRVTAIINKLNDHILGKAKMTGTMVRAAEILLRKVQPDLLATAISGVDNAALPLLKIVRRSEPEPAKVLDLDGKSAGAAADKTG